MFAALSCSPGWLSFPASWTDLNRVLSLGKMNRFYSKPQEAIANIFPSPTGHITYEHAIQAFQVHLTPS